MRPPSTVARALARSIGWLSRHAGRGGGTTVPGVILLRLRPDAVAELAGPLGRSIVISATNGKTTTARLVVAALEAVDTPIVANTAGSNLLRGVATALLDAERPTGATGVFEVDEAAMGSVVEQLAPEVIVLMNLFRDQLDRYGELEALADGWVELVDRLPETTTLVLNADDPAIAELAHRHAKVVTFGVDDASAARAAVQHAADSTTCRNCSSPLVYERVFIGHLGHWRCPNCDRRRPPPDVSVAAFDPEGISGSSLTVATPTGPVAVATALPGLHNAYNVAAAVATASSLGLDLQTSARAIGSTGAAFGRAERVALAGHDLMVLLAKNPAGVNENLRTLVLHPDPLHLLVLLNDRTADGRDVSWIWDVDYEEIFDRVGSLTICGDRGHDMALRFRYGGFPVDRLTVHSNVGDALDAALLTMPDRAPLFALPTYTAMLELRAELVRRGVADDFWKDA